MIDTHCHIHDFSVYKYVCKTKGLDAEGFTPEKLVRRAEKNGVSGLICVGTTMADSRVARDFAEKNYGGVFRNDDNTLGYSSNSNTSNEMKIFWAYGIHPDESEKMTEVNYEKIERDFLELNGGSFLKAGKRRAEEVLYKNMAVAIGEIGLDFHRMKRNAEGRFSGVDAEEVKRQMELLRKMLRLAIKYQLPVIFHVREAFPEFFRVVDSAEFRGVSGVVHSFSDSEEAMQGCLARGFYIGIGGIATFQKKAPLPPIERILLETDAPFLTPTPYRKEVNEPYYVRSTAEFLAGRYSEEDGAKRAKVPTKASVEITEGSTEEIIAQSDRNAEKLFGI